MNFSKMCKIVPELETKANLCTSDGLVHECDGYAWRLHKFKCKHISHRNMKYLNEI